MAQNCWEFKRCERQRGGAKAEELGICPAAYDPRYRGINDGANGGRICWAVAGSFCGGVKQGTFADKYPNCKSCPFFIKVGEEQGVNFKLMALVTVK